MLHDALKASSHLVRICIAFPKQSLSHPLPAMAGIRMQQCKSDRKVHGTVYYVRPSHRQTNQVRNAGGWGSGGGWERQWSRRGFWQTATATDHIVNQPSDQVAYAVSLTTHVLQLQLPFLNDEKSAFAESLIFKQMGFEWNIFCKQWQSPSRLSSWRHELVCCGCLFLLSQRVLPVCWKGWKWKKSSTGEKEIISIKYICACMSVNITN